MPKVHSHYENLKVAQNEPPEVIRAVYKTLSQKNHMHLKYAFFKKEYDHQFPFEKDLG